MTKKPTRLAPCLLSILLSLLLVLLPASAAQRRRQTRPAPASKPTTTPRTAPGASPATTTPQTNAPARESAPADAAEDELTFDTLVAADSYAIYFEARRVGQLARSKDFTELLDSFIPQTGPPQELSATVEFFKAHAEALENAQLHVVAMPTRPGLPQSIGALQLPSVEEARRVEPALRGLVNKYETASATAAAKESELSAQVGTRKMRTGGTNARRAATPVKAESKPAEPVFNFKRVGRLLLLSDAPVNARALRAATRQPLFTSQRLQAARTRLATEQLFLFLDMGLLQKGENVERERYIERARKEEAERAARPSETPPAEKEEEPVDDGVAAEVRAELSAAADSNAQQQTQEPGFTPEEAAEMAAANERLEAARVVGAEGPPAEIRAVGGAEMLVSRFFGMAFGGAPVWPEAVGVGASLGGEDITLRAVMMNGAGAETRVIPFLPFVVSGPEVVNGASSVAPEDSEVFVSLSLDWQKLYSQLLGFANQQQAEYEREARESGGGEPTPPEMQSPEKSIEAVEKLFGFKIKEDLLPALGGELAVCAPLGWITGSGYSGRRRPLSKTAQEAEPGFVIFVSLNNADAVRKILPRVLEALSLKTVGSASQTERRAGLEIVHHGGISTAFLGNYLAISPRPEPLRHVADSYARQGVLASNENFRAAVEWQPRQTLAQVYVSRSMMEDWLKEMRLWADPNDAELQTLFARYDVRPRPAAYAVTNEGGGDLFHELHLPVGLLKLFASADTVQRARTNPLRAGEMMTIRQLYALADAQEAYKERDGKGSFATLEQLMEGRAGEQYTITDDGGSERHEQVGYFPREVVEKLGYRLSVSAAGDKYVVIATPKEYGKNGRRSFYLDETGVVRGADHNGQPANASDPPVDE